MGNNVLLPITDENGCYKIRLESIGGLGANLCGKMLGELGLKRLGLNSASFSSYGSEKTGTPVKGFVRYSAPDMEIRVHSPIRKPHLLAVFHSALLSDASVLEGCGSDTSIVINTADGKEWEEFGGRENYKGVYFVDAQHIAIETKSRVNVVMLGAIAKVMGFVGPDALNAICEAALGRKYPAALPGNLEGIRRGFEEVRTVRETGGKGVKKERKVSTPGYGSAPAGGIITEFGNSVVNDLSPSRQGYFPIFLPEKCIHCGLCDTACPDMVFQFQKGEFKGREMMINKGLDYYHCKGCLRCVEVCPVQALVVGVEAEHPDKAYFMPNQDLIRTPPNYEKAGPDGYVTSESYLTERRMKGGEV